MPAEVKIPHRFVVHLGPPGEEADTLSLPFPDYLATTACTSLSPLWPPEALAALVTMAATFALRRGAWHRAHGHGFDITTADQPFEENHALYENLSRLALDRFDRYLADADAQPADCPGLAPPDAEAARGCRRALELAQGGCGEEVILARLCRFERMERAPLAPLAPGFPEFPWPGFPLSQGDSGTLVRILQLLLNRVSAAFPGIPKLRPITGHYTAELARAVRAFQRVCDLEQTGEAGHATWMRLTLLAGQLREQAVFPACGQAALAMQYVPQLEPGAAGAGVWALQRMLAVAAMADEHLLAPEPTGVFDPATALALEVFQRRSHLPQELPVEPRCWQKLTKRYRGALGILRFGEPDPPFPGAHSGASMLFSQGARGEAVRLIQERLAELSAAFPAIPRLEPSGLYGPQTQNAVLRFQNQFGLTADGLTGPKTWTALQEIHALLRDGAAGFPGQYPGIVLGEED